MICCSITSSIKFFTPLRGSAKVFLVAIGPGIFLHSGLLASSFWQYLMALPKGWHGSDLAIIDVDFLDWLSDLSAVEALLLLKRID